MTQSEVRSFRTSSDADINPCLLPVISQSNVCSLISQLYQSQYSWIKQHFLVNYCPLWSVCVPNVNLRQNPTVDQQLSSSQDWTLMTSIIHFLPSYTNMTHSIITHWQINAPALVLPCHSFSSVMKCNDVLPSDTEWNATAARTSRTMQPTDGPDHIFRPDQWWKQVKVLRV